MAKFVDQTEKRATAKRQPEKKVEDKQRQDLREQIPAAAFETNILDSSLPEHVAYTLQENGYNTVGDLVMQMKLDEDSILRLQGIGPRAMQEIQKLVEVAAAPAAEPAEAEQPVVEEVPGGFETVVAAPVEEIVEAVEKAEDDTEMARAEEVVITPPSPVQEAAEEETPAVEEEGVVTGQAEGEPAEALEGEETSFDELFTLRPEVIPSEATGEDEEEEESASGKTGKKKSKKKKKGSVEVEFDPDANRVFVRKKHKRGGEEWEW
jgi:N utilization substance protein A